MKALVAYSSKYGFTKGIAEFIAKKLQEQGTEAEVLQVDAVHNASGYDAFVIGSAVYMEHWMKDATEFVLQNKEALASRPVWLFSSGPLGTQTKDPQGRDLRVISEPKEISEFRKTIHPRDHRVFFGAFDRKKLGFKDRLVAMMPAARALFPEGDFRDWNDIEAWTTNIHRALQDSQKASSESITDTG